MKIIGITGGIGTGKSTVLKILKEEYNAYIIETDRLAHALMNPGEEAYKQIVAVFSEEILNEAGEIDRGVLGQLVFRNKNKLQQLNAIVHPAVKQYILRDIEEKRQENKTVYYVIEAALLIEDGYKEICDELWYIYAARDIRVQRLLSGRGGTKEKWLQVISNQSSEDFYREHCDVMIDNGEGLEKTKISIKELLCK